MLWLGGACLGGAEIPAMSSAAALGLNTTAALTANVTGLAAAHAPNTATIPVPQRAMAYAMRHQFLTNRAKGGGIELLFLGDTLIEQWEGVGRVAWMKYYGNLKAANFGAFGDRIQNVLWRVQHGEGEGFTPKVIVLLAGLNNTGYERDGVTPRNTSAEAAEGIAALVTELRQHFPDGKILLLGLLPHGDPGTGPRNQVAEINRAIAKLDDGQHIFYLDLGPSFLDEKGNFRVGVMQGDRTHPTVLGYEVWAQTMQPLLTKLLK